MIEVTGLTKIFPNGVKAINSLDLEVKDGEILALLGPNGAGKTTTIRVLSTLSGFDEGTVRVAGYDVDTHPQEVRRTIGVVAQKTGVDFFLSGRENLMLQGRLYRMKKADIERRVEELAKYFELEGALDRTVMTYSGGMQRKLDIATALIHSPKVIYLDEPTLGLDIKSRQNLWKYIEKLNREQGLTILLTTHYLEEADQLSDRVAIINNGTIQVVDTSEALKNSIHGDSIILTFATEGPEVGDFTYSLHDDPDVKDVVWDNDQLHLYVDNGGTAVPHIVQAAEKQGVTIETLRLARPTLDDVFLKYTGTSMESAGEEEGGEEWWHQWAGKGGGGGKWEKNWQKWQQQLDETGTDEQKADWQQHAAQWQNTGTTDTPSSETKSEDSSQWNGEAANSPEEVRDERQQWAQQQWKGDGAEQWSGEWKKENKE